MYYGIGLNDYEHEDITYRVKLLVEEIENLNNENKFDVNIYSKLDYKYEDYVSSDSTKKIFDAAVYKYLNSVKISQSDLITGISNLRDSGYKFIPGIENALWMKISQLVYGKSVTELKKGDEYSELVETLSKPPFHKNRFSEYDYSKFSYQRIDACNHDSISIEKIAIIDPKCLGDMIIKDDYFVVVDFNVLIINKLMELENHKEIYLRNLKKYLALKDAVDINNHMSNVHWEATEGSIDYYSSGDSNYNDNLDMDQQSQEFWDSI